MNILKVYHMNTKGILFCWLNREPELVAIRMCSACVQSRKRPWPRGLMNPARPEGALAARQSEKEACRSKWAVVLTRGVATTPVICAGVAASRQRDASDAAQTPLRSKAG